LSRERDVVPKKTLYIRDRSHSTQKERTKKPKILAGSSADDVKRSFSRLDEEAEKVYPPLDPHPICLAANCGATYSFI
jgi:hypothetical protein